MIQRIRGRVGWARDHDIDPDATVVDEFETEVPTHTDMEVLAQTDAKVPILADTGTPNQDDT